VALIGLISTVIRTLDETMELKNGTKVEEKWKKNGRKNNNKMKDLKWICFN